MLHLSTFSIVACDLNERAWGVAVASKFLAAGAVVPFAQAGAGAIATQSYANTSYGPRGLPMLAHRAPAPGGSPTTRGARCDRWGSWTPRAARRLSPGRTASPGLGA